MEASGDVGDWLMVRAIATGEQGSEGAGFNSQGQPEFADETIKKSTSMIA